MWRRDADDWYVEPSWCSERLFEAESFVGGIVDPACGMGRIVEAAERFGHAALAVDLVKRRDDCMYALDFTSSEWPREIFFRTGWENIVSNPPFKHAEAFVRHALAIVPRKIAFLLPANWVQGDERSRWLEATPLAKVYFITPRPSMPPGAIVAAGLKPGNGTTDFAWFVWDQAHKGPVTIGWLRRDREAAAA